MQNRNHIFFLRSGLIGSLLFTSTLSAQDFNLDGFQDAVIGTPAKDSGGLADSGLIHVVLGGAGGPNPATSILRHEGMAGGVVNGGERFGHAVAWGDFNADGWDDLAVSAPLDAAGGLAGAGQVYVLFGPGLAAGPALVSLGGPQAGAQFGMALAAADFDNDGFDDLAVGAPLYDAGGVPDSGRVDIFYGPGFGGLIVTQAATGNAVEPGDAFGSSLAAGNFNGDMFADLGVGTPNENLGAAVDCGMLGLLAGSPAGIPAGGGASYDQGVVGGVNQNGDKLGTDMTVGDFDGNGYGDLVGAALGQTIGGMANAGAVFVYMHGFGGLIGGGGASQNTPGILEAAQAGDSFGSALASGDFNADGIDDLAVGVPGEDLAPGADAGIVQVLYGVFGVGLTSAGDIIRRQVGADFEAMDLFAASLVAGDYNNDGWDDLLAGAPFEDRMALADVGVVNYLSGAAGLPIVGLLAQDLMPFADPPAAGDQFGSSL